MDFRFPLVGCELSRVSRKRWVYAVRSVLAVAACFFLLAAHGGLLGTRLDAMERLGGMLAGLVCGFGYLVTFLMAPLLAADLMAPEKEERSLGLLMLTGLSRADILLGKLAAVFLPCEALILSSLPIQALSAFLGGVSVWAGTIHYLVLSLAIASMAAWGLFCSTVCHRRGEALCCALGGALFYLGGTSLWDLTLGPGRGAPGCPNMPAQMERGGADPFLAWMPSLVLLAGILIGSSAAAHLLLFRSVHEGAGGQRKRPRPTRRRPAPGWMRLLNGQDRLLLASLDGTSRRGRLHVVLLSTVVGPPAMLAFGAGYALIAAAVVSDIL